MERKPKPHGERILPKAKMKLIFILGMIGTFVALGLFHITGGESINTLMRAQTFVFNFVVLYELMLVFIIRKDYKVRFFSNKWVWSAVLLSIALQALLMYTPLNVPFGIMPLSLNDIGILAFSGLVFYTLSMGYYHLIHRKHSENLQFFSD